MRFSTLAVGLALACGATSVANGQGGSGYVGVYVDAAGTMPCAVVPTYTGETLYLLATPPASSAGGITGAEFRVEVANPNGWEFSFFPPASATVMGDPLDTQPNNPSDGSGVIIAFRSCRTPPQSGVIPLGTISVFNISGSATQLQVKRHSTPSNSSAQCPLFILCDDPVFSKTCMASAPAMACSSLAPTKVSGVATDPAVFSLTIGDHSLSTPTTPSTFVETLIVGASEVWVAGQLVEADVISAGADGQDLFFNDVRIPLIPDRLVDAALETRKEAVFSKAPRYTALHASGLTSEEARIRFKAELSRVYSDAHAAFIASGHNTAYQVLRSSSLLEAVTPIDDGIFTLRCAGWSGVVTYDCRSVERHEDPAALRARNSEAARRTVEAVQARLADGVPRVFVIKSGLGMDIWEGELGEQASQQLHYARSGRPLQGLPQGPLGVSDPSIQAASAGRAGK